MIEKSIKELKKEIDDFGNFISKAEKTIINNLHAIEDDLEKKIEKKFDQIEEENIKELKDSVNKIIKDFEKEIRAEDKKLIRTLEDKNVILTKEMAEFIRSKEEIKKLFDEMQTLKVNMEKYLIDNFFKLLRKAINNLFKRK